MLNRDTGESTPSKSTGGGANNDGAGNDSGKDKKPKGKPKKTTKPKPKKDKQKPKTSLNKPLPEGFVAMEDCRLDEDNKLSKCGKMKARQKTVAENLGSVK